MRIALALVLLAACKYEPARATLDDGRPTDGAPDDAAPGDGVTVIDAPPAAACFGSFVSICLPDPLPTAQRVIDNLAIDTDTATECATLAVGSFNACVLAGSDLIIDGTVTAVGARPLVLLAAAGTVTLNGNAVVDVSSHRIGDVRGAAANPSTCAGTTEPSGGGGGYGGSGFGVGGNGGGAAGGSVAGVAGSALSKPTTLVGGCSGAQGGNQGGVGGDGGGAIALIATNDIQINGILKASGTGGTGGRLDSARNGGGGGGAGGLIVFDLANTLTINSGAEVFAQAGGGGEGGSNTAAGTPGFEPVMLTVPALGGSTAPGGNGGFGGSTGAGTAGGSVVGNDGAGGGGGGTGFILSTKGPQASSRVSPAIQATP